MKNLVRKSILATLAYYGALDYPLTTFDLYRLAIPAGRFGGYSHKFSYREILDCVGALKRENKISEKNGFFMLKGREDLCFSRIEKKKINDQKWKKAVKFFSWFQAVPFVRAVFASGSLSLGNTGEKSDLDVLIVVEGSRIWTCRLFVSLIMSALGARRTKYDKIAPDKVCLNHYISDKFLRIPFESIYTAHLYRHLTPVFLRDDKLLEEFKLKNSWVGKYVNTWELGNNTRFRKFKKMPVLAFIARVFEKVLKTKAGDLVERLSRAVQRSRIMKDSNYKKSGGRITIDDKQLEFHPDSPEKRIIEKFNSNLAKISELDGYFEVDSGLN